MQVNVRYFAPVKTACAEIRPRVDYVVIKGASRARLLYDGDHAAFLAKLRASGVFRLPPQLMFIADVIQNGSIPDAVWFNQRDTRETFLRLIGRDPSARMMIGTNAGQTPAHKHEAAYDSSLPEEQLACRDFEVENGDSPARGYACVLQRGEAGVEIGRVSFGADRKPVDRAVTLAVGGRPLIENGQAVELDEFLEATVTDPRHLLFLPQLTIGPRLMPLGLRTLQAMIINGKAAEIIARVEAGEPILVDLGLERECWQKHFLPEEIQTALARYGYSETDYAIERDRVMVRLHWAPYRHTFWAKRGDDILIGLIANEVIETGKMPDEKYLAEVLKPQGLTIPQLMRYLVEELKVDAAVLLGSGKDPRRYTSLWPHDPQQVSLVADNDIRPCITAGMLAIATY